MQFHCCLRVKSDERIHGTFHAFVLLLSWCLGSPGHRSSDLKDAYDSMLDCIGLFCIQIYRFI